MKRYGLYFHKDLGYGIITRPVVKRSEKVIMNFRNDLIEEVEVLKRDIVGPRFN